MFLTVACYQSDSHATVARQSRDSCASVQCPTARISRDCDPTDICVNKAFEVIWVNLFGQVDRLGQLSQLCVMRLLRDFRPTVVWLLF